MEKGLRSYRGRNQAFLGRSLAIFNPSVTAALSKERDIKILGKLLKLKPIDRELVRGVTQFSDQEALGESIGRTSRTVRNRLKRHDVQEAIDEIEDKQDREVLDTKRRIRSMIGKALGKVDILMDSEDEAIALRASNSILDRDPESKVKTNEVPQYAVLTPEGLEFMAQVIGEVKGEVDGTNNGTDKNYSGTAPVAPGIN